jgi:hypothetical protein
MTELITSHAYQRGPYGRCAVCQKRRAAHGEPRTISASAVSEVRFGTRDEPEVVMVPYLAEPTTFVSDDPEPLVEAPSLPVYFQLRRGLDDPGEEIRLSWPATWPLPRIGDSVTVNGQGRVSGIVFDLDRGRIVLVCN